VTVAIGNWQSDKFLTKFGQDHAMWPALFKIT